MDYRTNASFFKEAIQGVETAFQIPVVGGLYQRKNDLYIGTFNKRNPGNHGDVLVLLGWRTTGDDIPEANSFKIFYKFLKMGRIYEWSSWNNNHQTFHTNFVLLKEPEEE